MRRRTFLVTGSALTLSGCSCASNNTTPGPEPASTCVQRAANALRQTLHMVNSKGLDALLPLVPDESRAWLEKMSGLAKKADRGFVLELPDQFDPSSLKIDPGSPTSARAILIRPPAVRKLGLRAHQGEVLVFLGEDTHRLPPQHGEVVDGLTPDPATFEEQLRTLTTFQRAKLPKMALGDGKAATLVAFTGLNIEPGRIERVEVKPEGARKDEHQDFTVSAWERGIRVEFTLSDACDRVLQLQSLDGVPVAEFFKARVAAHRLEDRRRQ